MTSALYGGSSSGRMSKSAIKYMQGLENKYNKPMEEYVLGLRGNSGIYENTQKQLAKSPAQQAARADRMSDRYQTNTSAAMQDYTQDTRDLQTSLRNTYNSGQARKAEHQFDQALLTSGISYGQKLAQRGNEGIQASHAQKEQIDNQNEAAAKQRRTQMITTAIAIAGTAAMFMM